MHHLIVLCTRTLELRRIFELSGARGRGRPRHKNCSGFDANCERLENSVAITPRHARHLLGITPLRSSLRNEHLSLTSQTHFGGGMQIGSRQSCQRRRSEDEQTKVAIQQLGSFTYSRGRGGEPGRQGRTGRECLH